MSNKFRVDGHQYYSLHTQSLDTQFFRDGIEVTLAEFYDAFFRRLRQLKRTTRLAVTRDFV